MTLPIWWWLIAAVCVLGVAFSGWMAAGSTFYGRRVWKGRK